MEQSIRVNAVVFRIATTCGIYPSLIVALLPEQIVEVEGNNQRFVFEEGL
jgi:hypothetical protein